MLYIDVIHWKTYAERNYMRISIYTLNYNLDKNIRASTYPADIHIRWKWICVWMFIRRIWLYGRLMRRIWETTDWLITNTNQYGYTIDLVLDMLWWLDLLYLLCVSEELSRVTRCFNNNNSMSVGHGLLGRDKKVLVVLNYMSNALALLLNFISSYWCEKLRILLLLSLICL